MIARPTGCRPSPASHSAVVPGLQRRPWNHLLHLVQKQLPPTLPPVLLKHTLTRQTLLLHRNLLAVIRLVNQPSDAELVQTLPKANSVTICCTPFARSCILLAARGCEGLNFCKAIAMVDGVIGPWSGRSSVLRPTSSVTAIPLAKRRYRCINLANPDAPHSGPKADRWCPDERRLYKLSGRKKFRSTGTC
jgi:hypothetical protein